MNLQASISEFVGNVKYGETLGLVIANVSSVLRAEMGLSKNDRAIGIISNRTGAGSQVMAADEAVKSTNARVVSVELPRDTKGGPGHGCLIILASEDVEDVRNAVQIALENTERNFGEVYEFESGHLDLHYTARASHALNKGFNAPLGQAFGIIVGAPAGMGLVMADTALKAAPVELVNYMSPSKGTAHSNEVIITITGDSEAVKQAVKAAREVGFSIAKSMGQNPVSVTGRPYI